MLEHDGHLGTELVGTLATYLRSDCNMNTTAAAGTCTGTPSPTGSTACTSSRGSIRAAPRIGSGWGSR